MGRSRRAWWAALSAGIVTVVGVVDAFIGGDVIVTLPSVWQKRFNASEVEVRPRMQDPVEPWIVDELRRRFADFERAYEPEKRQWKEISKGALSQV